MKTIDLHTHSTASDGMLTPTELVNYAAEKGLAAVALTDHDTLAGIAEARKAAESLGVLLVPGAEFSTMYEKISLHIVGLFLPEDSPEITDRLEYMRSSRITRNKKMLDNLRAEGPDITEEELQEEFPDSVISRAHIAQLLQKKGYVSSKNEAFDRYIGSHCKAYVEKESLSPRETIELIKNAGGIAVWAHPLLCRLGEANLDKMTGLLKEYGLDAIEAYYPSHSPSDTRHVKFLAEKYGLLLSGGSDFHGSIKPGLDLGTGYGSLCVPYEVLEKLTELKEKRIWQKEIR